MGHAEWHTTDIEVTIKEIHPESGLRRQNGVIRNVLVTSQVKARTVLYSFLYLFLLNVICSCFVDGILCCLPNSRRTNGEHPFGLLATSYTADK